jgi:hypothetical protein
MLVAANNPPLDLKLDRFVPQLDLKQEAGKKWIKGAIRKQWFVLQPEEFVRQLLLNFLIRDMRYNRNRITVERGVEVIGQQRRTDILVFDPDMRPFLLIECKAPSIELKQDVFRQASMYNRPLQVPYLMISNGRASYVCHIDYERKRFTFLDHPPEFPQRK